jgi:3-methyl-2-oxobutanoate hydroxymethyltransferase
MTTPGNYTGNRQAVTLAMLGKMKRRGEKIVCLTAYDAGFTTTLEAAGVDVLLVGDSLGMVIQGHTSTRPVSVNDMIYHTRCVSRARQRALIIADMPFKSYSDPEQAVITAAHLIEEGGADAVKPEGGAAVLDIVKALVDNDIPVCGHLGLLPQSVEKPDGYRVQGRDEESARAILYDAMLLQEAGAGMLVLECVPSSLARDVTQKLSIPVIGIGAGPHCDGQVLVLYDMLGITAGKLPKFVKNFLADAAGIQAAVEDYARAVRSGEYPAAEHCYD